MTGLVHTKEAMDRREQELADRERQLVGIEEQVRNGTYKPKKNFPPILGWWAWHPAKDLPQDVQPAMRKLRWVFIGITLAYAVNVIGVFALLNCTLKEEKDGKMDPVDPPFDSQGISVVLAVFFLLVLCPFSFEFVFFYFYKAFQRGKVIRFFIALGFYIIWFLVLAFNIIGLRIGGSVGFAVMGRLFSHDKVGLGVIGLIFVIIAIAMGLAMAFGFIWLWRYYRQNGLAGKAKEEAAGMAVDYAREHPDQAAAVAGAAAGGLSGA